MSEAAARSALRKLLEPLARRTPVEGSRNTCVVTINGAPAALTEDILRALRLHDLMIVRRSDVLALSSMVEELGD